MLRNRLSNLEDRMRFAGVEDDGLADPLVVYFFRPGQITQASVVIFLELSVTHIISHAEKYPSPILAAAIPPFVTKNSTWTGVKKRMCRSSRITMFTRSCEALRASRLPPPAILPRVRRQARHTGGHPQACRGRQLVTSIPLLTREIDPIPTLHPQLRREIVARQNVVKPVRPVLT